MIKEKRRIIYDDELGVEAISFNGIHQSFSKHFHDYYVIGVIRKGNRKLICNDNKYDLVVNSILLLNPNDYHECEDINEEQLDYMAIHISKKLMNNLVEEIFKSEKTAVFNRNVIYDKGLLDNLEILSYMLFNNVRSLEKEELFYIIVKELLVNYANFDVIDDDSNLTIKDVCNYIKNNYSDDITLDELSKIGGVSKYHLIRTFTREKHITPYKYLELYRINEAKKLLQKDFSILEVAMKCGFSDQCHLSNLFKLTIGITPRQYKNIFVERKSKNE